MPTYVYWGDDEYQLAQAVNKLEQKLVDPAWREFNYTKIVANTEEKVSDGLSQSVTPPFGMGNRLTWLSQTVLATRCSEGLLKEVERTLECLPENSCLLLTADQKFDGRIKSTKLLQKNAEFVEFSTIPPWKTDALAQLVRQAAKEIGLPLTDSAVNLLADAIGNDTRRLYSELHKLQLLRTDDQPLDAAVIAPLIPKSAHNALQLASAIVKGNSAQALDLLMELINNNEAGLRIVATLTSQFRLWTWVKVLLEGGERDDSAIATAADLGNPKRVYFLKQELQQVQGKMLIKAMGRILQLEADLKIGREEIPAMQTAILELCYLMGRAEKRWCFLMLGRGRLASGRFANIVVSNKLKPNNRNN